MRDLCLKICAPEPFGKLVAGFCIDPLCNVFVTGSPHQDPCEPLVQGLCFRISSVVSEYDCPVSEHNPSFRI